MVKAKKQGYWSVCKRSVGSTKQRDLSSLSISLSRYFSVSRSLRLSVCVCVFVCSCVHACARGRGRESFQLHEFARVLRCRGEER